mmetsp:Transcript_23948/g.95028  ORF Transcript_23948/g.95028 Transcript_23948/m.95028 type:complete len:602 (-) Transcript_23948:1199-3004(-)
MTSYVRGPGITLRCWNVTSRVMFWMLISQANSIRNHESSQRFRPAFVRNPKHPSVLRACSSEVKHDLQTRTLWRNPGIGLLREELSAVDTHGQMVSCPRQRFNRVHARNGHGGNEIGRHGMLSPVSQNTSTSTSGLGQASVYAALEELKQGRPVVVTDDADRENEGDLIFAAQRATRKLMAFVVRYTSGVICVAMQGERLEELGLRQMVDTNEDPKGTAFTISVDVKGQGVTTGISACDRAATLRALADPSCTEQDFCRPGHIFPLRSRSGGVLERGGHTEAAVDLMLLAGLFPAGGLCELVCDDGEMMRARDLESFRDQHRLVMTTIADIRAYREELVRQHEHQFGQPLRHYKTMNNLVSPNVRRGSVARLPTEHGPFQIICFVEASGLEHAVLARGFTSLQHDVPSPIMYQHDKGTVDWHSNLVISSAAKQVLQSDSTLPDHDMPAPLVRIHSECATGDIFSSRRCDCGEQLEIAMADISSEVMGLLLYIRGHEGRGIGLNSKLAAYALQDRGRDTVEANRDQGLPVDARSYAVAAAMLFDLGISQVRLMTNNPSKCDALRRLGINVTERVPLLTAPNAENYDYLLTKQRKMGHILNLP